MPRESNETSDTSLRRGDGRCRSFPLTRRSTNVGGRCRVTRVHCSLRPNRPTRTREKVASRRRFSRLFKDPRAIEVTITLTDEVMRIHSLKSSIDIFRRAAAKASVEGFGRVNALGLKLLAVLSRVAPSLVIKSVAATDSPTTRRT